MGFSLMRRPECVQCEVTRDYLQNPKALCERCKAGRDQTDWMPQPDLGDPMHGTPKGVLVGYVNAGIEQCQAFLDQLQRERFQTDPEG